MHICIILLLVPIQIQGVYSIGKYWKTWKVKRAGEENNFQRLLIKMVENLEILKKYKVQVFTLFVKLCFVFQTKVNRYADS